MIDIGLLIIVLGSILVSMTLHEAMHAYVSYWLGDDTARHEGRLTLNPLAHIDPYMTVLLPLLLTLMHLPPFGAAKPVPFNPNRLRFGEMGAALVGAAGPLTNLSLAIIAGVVLRVYGGVLGGTLVEIFSIFILVNLSFFLFNAIPFPPLDGSRVVYAFAPEFVRRFMRQIEASGPFALMAFFILFYLVLSDPFSRILSVLFDAVIGGGSLPS
jgi:Zn-dependent protease